MSERDAAVLMMTNDVSAASGGIAITTSGTHTKGAYTTLIAAAANTFDVYELWISATSTFVNGTDTGYSVDIAIGGAGSEIIIVPDILVGFRDPITMSQFRFPVFIPAGTRISARGQSVQSADVVALSIHAVGGSPWGNPEVAGGGYYTTYGFTAATTRGLQLNASATPHVKGSWGELVASTTRDHTIIVPSFQLHDASANTSLCSMRVDIGVGAAASEQVIIPDIYIRSDATEIMGGPVPAGAFLVRKIPAGSRLAARCQASVASDSNTNVVAHCA